MLSVDCVGVLEGVSGVRRRPEQEVNVQFPGVSTDSRRINKGELFVAIKGPNFDGHDFVLDAFQKGAAGAIISRMVSGLEAYPDRVVFVVPDTLKALGDLAKYMRRKLATRVIGITGSNGKTTTKEMIYQILSRVTRVSRAEKSFNNFVGVPLTIFGMDPSDEFAVIEMGMNAPGEIKYLASIAQPDLGVITNICPAHLQGLGSETGVANAKAELLDAIRPDGVAFLNADNKWTPTIAPRCRGRIITFGLSTAADVRATDVVVRGWSLNFTLHLNGRTEITIPIIGRFNVLNALAAAAVCHHVGLSVEQIREGFRAYKAPAMRLEPIQIGDMLVIMDAYNANPVSMAAAVETFAEIQTKGRKVMIFGDMLELGEESEEFHRSLGKLLAVHRFDLLWAIGPGAGVAADAAISEGFPADKVLRAASSSDAECLAPSLRRDDTVLLKGSRGMTLETVLKAIQKQFGVAH